MRNLKIELSARTISYGVPWQFPILNRLLPLFVLSCLLLIHPSSAEDEKPSAKPQSGKEYADVLSKLQKEAAGTDLGKMDEFRALQKKIGKETAELSRETRKLGRELEALNAKRERTRKHLEKFSDLAPGTVEKAELEYLKKAAEQEALNSKLNALRNKTGNSTEEEDSKLQKEISELEKRIEVVRKEKDKISGKLSEWWRKMDEAQKDANESTLKPGPLNLVDTSVVPDEDLIGLNDYLEKRDSLARSLEEKKELLEKMRKLKEEILAKAKEEKEKKEKAAQSSGPANSGQASKLNRPNSATNVDSPSSQISASREQEEKKDGSAQESKSTVSEQASNSNRQAPDKDLGWLSDQVSASKEQEFEPEKELVKLAEMATGIRERLEELAMWIDPFIYERSVDPSAEYLMPDATDDVRKQWKNWASLSSHKLKEWANRNQRIAERNEKVLAQAISENEPRLAVYRDKDDKSSEELTPETAERLKSEFIQFVMRLVSIRQHQEDTFEALGTVIDHQQKRNRLIELRRPHDRAHIDYYDKYKKSMPKHLEAQEKAISASYQRRIDLHEKFISELWERKERNDVRQGMLMQKRHDLPEIGKLNREALVMVGNIDAPQRKWSVAGWVPENFFTWLEGDLQEIASEAEKDLEQRSYKTNRLFVSGRSEKTAVEERAMMLKHLKRKDLRALVVVAHGSKVKLKNGTDPGAGFEIGRPISKEDGTVVQYGLVPSLAAQCRQGLPPLDILLMHSCNQDYGNRGNEWRKALGLASDGVFKSWNKFVDSSEALAWQKEWK